MSKDYRQVADELIAALNDLGNLAVELAAPFQQYFYEQVGGDELPEKANMGMERLNGLFDVVPIHERPVDE